MKTGNYYVAMAEGFAIYTITRDIGQTQGGIIHHEGFTRDIRRATSNPDLNSALGVGKFLAEINNSSSRNYYAVLQAATC